MYLKRIEIEGFKSFADRTVIPFESGLTGIVGPNGCGKSNVVDALLWVMAERSPKALRADAMEDVIFEGSEGRPPAPYAMAEIILVDEGNDLDGQEVAVGRRLFRSGESEFLLNGRKVRRKDVREVLLKAGLGVRGYMVLAQGKIDAVLAANPKDRRSVLEEAAGISRYKARKHETLLKLSGVAQNLDRVDDVLGEVQRVVRSLRYQAGKAQRYLEMRDRYRELRVRVALGDETRFREEERALSAREAEVEAGLAALRAAREAAEERLKTLEREDATLRSRWESLRSEASGAKEEAAGLEERVHGLEARAAELDQRVGRERERLEELARVGRERAATTASLDEELRGLAAERTAAEEVLQAAENGYEQALAAHRGLREGIESLRRGVLEALAERTRLHNELAVVSQRRSEAEGALRSLERRLAEASAERERLDGEREAARKVLEATRVRVEAAEGENAARIAERDRQREALQGHEATVQAARGRAAEARARLEALAAVDEGGQGLPPAVRNLLAAPPEGVAGLLLEGVRVAPPWDRLVENLLGRNQHGLWADGRGRTAGLARNEYDFFFPPEQAPSSVNVPAAQPLRSLLEGDSERCDALCARLGEVYCTESAQEAAELAARHPGAQFLSRDGELHGMGFARVGMLEGDAVGMLARRNARDAARAVIEQAESEEAAGTQALKETRAALEAVEQKLEELAGDLREALAERDRAEGRFEEAGRRATTLDEEHQALTLETAQVRAAFEEAAGEEAGLSRARDEAETRRAASSARLEEDEKQSTEVEEHFETARAALQEARIEHDRIRQRGEHLEERARETQAQAARAESERTRLEEEAGEILARAESLRAEADQGRTRIRELLGRRGELEQRVAEAAAQCERASQVLAAERERRDQEGGKLEQILEGRQEMALELQKVHLHREELSRAIREEFQQPLDALCRGLGIDPAAFEHDEESHQAESAELAGLRAKLEEIGSVNLEAVKELEEREERAAFLERERTDLMEARKALEETLEELDTQCRERFQETFTAVASQFESIFRRLFRGGRAEVVLTPDMDPLEAGIEITVRPPGKELRSINLLSGGERTLTALALLLAVFRSRPSPFCLLDEVDAALDDANVERFLGVLEDFTEGTQFIVVTHNRLTMGKCERLFGVTMRKAGVSMVVAVDLADVVAAGLTEGASRAASDGAPERPAGRMAKERLAELAAGEEGKEAFAEG